MPAQYFLDRATEARRDADAAKLANVRERCLRSEAAFLDMAARAQRGERMRAKIEAEKAETRALPEPAQHSMAAEPPPT